MHQSVSEINFTIHFASLLRCSLSFHFTYNSSSMSSSIFVINLTIHHSFGFPLQTKSHRIHRLLAHQSDFTDILHAFLQRCMEYRGGLAMRILSVCPSVRQTRELYQNRRKISPDFYTIRTKI